MKEYKYMDSEYKKNKSARFLEMIQNNKVYECFLGRDVQYRITSNDSFPPGITDTEVLLNCCLYPLYIKNLVNAETIIENIFDRLNNDDVDFLCIYQTIAFIRNQDDNIEFYSNLPVIFKLDKYKNKIIDLLRRRKDEFLEFTISGVKMYEPMKKILGYTNFFNGTDLSVLSDDRQIAGGQTEIIEF